MNFKSLNLYNQNYFAVDVVVLIFPNTSEAVFLFFPSCALYIFKREIFPERKESLLSYYMGCFCLKFFCKTPNVVYRHTL